MSGESIASPSPSNPISHKDSYDNPYFLGGNDHSNLILVSDRLTGAGDFNSWQQSMRMALNGRNKLCFVDGSLSQPSDGHKDASTWSRCNDVVRSWLINFVSKTIGPSILYGKTANGIWDNLSKRFKQSNVPRLYQIEQRLQLLRQGSLDVNEYYTKAITIWEEIKSTQVSLICECKKCTCNLDQQWFEIFERSFVIKFLYGLNDTYELVREQIIMIDPLPNLEKTLNLVIQHEHQKQIKTAPQSDSLVFQTGSSSAPSSQTTQVAAVTRTQKTRPRPVCSYYGLKGHVISKCYKLHGYPLGYKISSGETRCSNNLRFHD